MTFMDILRKSPDTKEMSILKIQKPYKTKPLYDKLKSMVENKHENQSHRIMEEVDNAIKEFQDTGAKTLDKEGKDKNKKRIEEINDMMSKLKVGKEHTKNPTKIKALSKNINLMYEVQPDILNSIAEIKSLDIKINGYKESLKEYEGTQGEEAEERKKEFNDALNAVKNVRLQHYNNLDKNKASVYHLLVGTYPRNIRTPTKQERKDSIRPPTKEKEVWDETLNTGIKNYKRAIAALQKDKVKLSARDVSNLKKKYIDEIKRLENEIKTGKEAKTPLILSQDYTERIKASTIGIGLYDKLRDAVKELKLPNYEEKILDMFITSKRKKTTKIKDRDLNKQEEALLDLIYELDSEEVSRGTLIRLKDRNILTNKFLYQLDQIVAGENKKLFHPKLMKHLVDIELGEKGEEISRRSSRTYIQLRNKLKEINPKMNVPSKRKMQTLMSKLRTTKIGVLQLARNVNKTKIPDNILYSELIKLFPVSQLNILTKKTKNLEDVWETITDMYYLKESDIEFDDGDEEGWSDKKIISVIESKYNEFIEDVTEEEKATAKQNITNDYYKSQIKRITSKHSEYQLYLEATIKLLNHYIKAKQRESSMVEGMDIDIDLEGSLKETLDTKEEINDAYRDMKSFIPDWDELKRNIIQEEKEQKKETPKAAPQLTSLEREFEEQKEKLTSKPNPYKISRAKRDKHGNPVYRDNPTTGEKEMVMEAEPDISPLKEAYEKQTEQRIKALEEKLTELGDSEENASEIAETEQKLKDTKQWLVDFKKAEDVIETVGLLKSLDSEDVICGKK